MHWEGGGPGVLGPPKAPGASLRALTMNETGPERANLTWQQVLAAYADGELDQAARTRVEQKLAESPELAMELRAQRGFSPRNEPFWLPLRPAEPSAEQWSEVWNRVETRLTPQAEPGRHHNGRAHWLRRGLLALALVLPTSAAASVALVVTLHSSSRPGLDVPVESDDGLLRLVQPDDIEIESLRRLDRGSLVVVQPPLNDSLN